MLFHNDLYDLKAARTTQSRAVPAMRGMEATSIFGASPPVVRSRSCRPKGRASSPISGSPWGISIQTICVPWCQCEDGANACQALGRKAHPGNLHAR